MRTSRPAGSPNPGTGRAQYVHVPNRRTLMRATDPDLVLEAGGKIFVASHGDRQVDVLTSSGERVGSWARGAGAVALAVDDALGLLVVVTDERE